MNALVLMALEGALESLVHGQEEAIDVALPWAADGQQEAKGVAVEREHLQGEAGRSPARKWADRLQEVSGRGRETGWGGGRDNSSHTHADLPSVVSNPPHRLLSGASAADPAFLSCCCTCRASGPWGGALPPSTD